MGRRSHAIKYVPTESVALQYETAMQNERPIMAAVWASEMGARIRYDLQFYHWWLRARRPCNCDECRWEREDRADRRDERRERRSERRERRSERRERRSIRRERRRERREARRQGEAGEPIEIESSDAEAKHESPSGSDSPGSPSGSASRAAQGHVY